MANDRFSKVSGWSKGE